MIQLIDQTVISLTLDGIEVGQIGVIQSDHWMTDFSKRLQVCSARTLDSMHRRGLLLDYSAKPKLVIIDRAHGLWSGAMSGFVGEHASRYSPGQVSVTSMALAT